MSAMDFSDPYIPHGATCHVIDYSSSHPDVAACMPGEGLIILRDRRVVGWCDVEDDVKRIAIYFTYQPWCKHYVLQLADKVKVVSGLTPLKVTHTYESVLKFEIKDFRNQGFPQIGLWKKDAGTVCITDLTACALPSANPVESVLSSKVRGLKLSADQVLKKLEEKRRLRRHCMLNVLGTDVSENSDKLNSLVPFVGQSSTPQRAKSKLLKHSLVIHHSWQRLLCKKWILGCDVQNNSSQPLRALSLSVMALSTGAPHTGGAGAEWRVVVRRPVGGAAAGGGGTGGSPWAALPADGVLEPGQRASIVGTLPEPAFNGRSPFVEVRGMVSATLPAGPEAWMSVPAWRLSVDAVLSGALVPFRGSEDAADVLACLACCPVGVRLRLEGRVGLSDRVAALLDEANLCAPGASPSRGVAPSAAGPSGPVGPSPAGVPRLLVGTGSPETPLHGALALLHVLATDACTLRLHLRDAGHAFLLAHRLLDGLPQHTRLRAAPADSLTAASVDDADGGPVAVEVLTRGLLHALEDELRALAGPGRPDGGQQQPARAALHRWEVATDRAAQRLRLHLAQAAPAVA